MSDTSISAVIAAAFADETDPVDHKGAGDAVTPIWFAKAEPAATAKPVNASHRCTPMPPLEARTPDLKPASVSKKRADSSKSDTVLKKLRSARGVTVPQIMETTGWQAHSVRGFLSAVVRKKLGLTLTNEIGKDGQRRYRVVDAGQQG